MFTLSADSGHAQAVVGYDEAQRTFIVRDSNFHHLVEYDAETLLEEQRLSGPAGLVLVPAEKTSFLEGLELPEAGLRDQVHCFHQALDSHCREAAAQALDKLQAGAPAHALTLAADLALCSYDGNTQLTIRCLDGLLERHPQNERLLLQKLDCLGGQDQRDERLALLSQACDRPNCSPAFMLRYADELRQDARELDQAVSWVRRALRKGFGHQALDCLAAVRWAQRAFPEALELYRFAAALNDKSERTAQQYFAVARHLNQTEEALHFLRKRFERYRRRSPFPAISLCHTLIQLGRRPEAIPVLADALQLRPEDGELRVYAAQIAFASGQDAEAGEHLRAAEGRISAARLSRERAKLASGQKDLQPAISLWREILRREPLALDAHQEVARLLAETEGGLAGCRHLEQACKANPRHVGLHQVLFSWLTPEGPRAVQPVLEILIALNPTDAGIRCERVRWLGRLTRWSEALAEADLAVELDPSHPVGHALRGWALKAEGRRPEAMEAYRRAITVSVDYDLSIMQGLVSCAATVLERRLALDFLRTELSRHLVYGSGVLAYRELAARELHADEVVKILQKVVAERPDLWHAWAAVIREFAVQRKFDQAVKAAESATARLPLSAELWNEVAALHQARNDSKSELAAREKALELSPGDIQAMRLLADCLGRAGELARARAMLEGALRTYPRDAGTLYLMALSHWKAAEKDPAIACVKEAVAFHPDFAPGWASLQSWGCDVGQPGLAREIAQRLTEQRKEDPASWLRLARFHWCDENAGEALRGVDQAIALRPTSVEARILKAQILTAEERFAEAAEVCNEMVWGAVAPAELRAMAACILQAEGSCAEAIDKMEASLADAPELLWAWEKMADWHLAEGKIDAAGAVTERISKAFPNSPLPLLRAASEYSRAGNYPEATELLEKALRLDPDCVETRTRLTIIQLQTNQFAAVRETIAALRQLGIEDWALAAEGCLSLQQSDVGFAALRLTELCSMPGAGNAAVELLSGAFFNLGHGPAMCEALERALETPEPFASTGWIWVAALRTKGRLPPLAALLKLQERRRLFRLTTIQYLRSIGCLASSAKFPNRLLSVPLFRWTLLRLKRRLGDLLHKDTEAWVEFALALAATGQKGACGKWIGDWRTRKKLRGSYFPFFELLSDLGKDADALEIGGEALRQASGRDRIRVQMRLAWLEANLGDTRLAAKLLEDLEKDSSVAPLCVVARSIIRVRDAAPEVRAREAVDGFNSIRLSLSRQHLANSPEFVRRYTRRSVGLLAAHGAGFKARLWGAKNTRPPFPHFQARD
jgi:tetratricopeptide (TPR) repeat protein